MESPSITGMAEPSMVAACHPRSPPDPEAGRMIDLA